MVSFISVTSSAEMLTREELEWLNDYHRRVYDTIGPMLIEEEREWLKEATAEI